MWRLRLLGGVLVPTVCCFGSKIMCPPFGMCNDREYVTSRHESKPRFGAHRSGASLRRRDREAEKERRGTDLDHDHRLWCEAEAIDTDGHVLGLGLPQFVERPRTLTRMQEDLAGPGIQKVQVVDPERVAEQCEPVWNVRRPHPELLPWADRDRSRRLEIRFLHDDVPFAL